MLLLTLRAQIHAAPEVEAVLKEAMRSATKVYNGLLWHLREAYKKTGKVDLSRKNLNHILKELPRAKDYYSMSVQLTREEVREAYKAFFALRKEGKTNHQAPGFRRKGYLSPLRYVQSGYKVEGDRVTVSLGTRRKDGVRQVSFRIAHRPGVRYERVRQLSIVYDTLSGRLEARLTVEVRANPKPGEGRVALDLGETILMAAAFDDGSAFLYSGRGLKAVRRYWQKVRANLKRGSRRWKEVAHRERAQVNDLLHQAVSHFLRECVRQPRRGRSRGRGPLGPPGGLGLREGSQPKAPRLALPQAGGDSEVQRGPHGHQSLRGGGKEDLHHLPRLREGSAFQQKTPRSIHLFLRLEGASGCQRGPEHLRAGFPGISRQGE
jgi:putative transposase